jgi:hypothetical protein
MIKLQRKAYFLIALLTTVQISLTAWATMANGTLYASVPLISLLFLLPLLIGYALAKEAWFSELFKWEELRMAVLVVLVINLLSSALLLITSEASHIDNTLDGVNLFRISLLIGAPIGVMFWIKLSKVFDMKSIVMLKMFMISFALINATVASQLNRKLDDPSESSVFVDILKKEQGGVGLASYLMQEKPPLFIFFQNSRGDEERLVAPKVVWNVAYSNANIELSVKEGYLGYHYVSRLSGLLLKE